MNQTPSNPHWRIVLILAMAMSIAGVAATLAGFGARWHWVLDLATHWPVQLTAGSLIPLGLLLALKRWKLAIIPALVVALRFIV